jgi:NADPH:quinone reductase-like Zn-dependent oxidoreductase
MLAARVIDPVVGATIPLAEIARAHALVERGGVVGKVVIDCR